MQEDKNIIFENKIQKDKKIIIKSNDKEPYNVETSAWLFIEVFRFKNLWIVFLYLFV